MKFQFKNMFRGGAHEAKNDGASGNSAFGQQKPINDARTMGKTFREFLIYRDLKAWHSMAKAFGESADGRADVEKKYSPGNDKEGFKLYMETYSKYRMTIGAWTSAGGVDSPAEISERKAFEKTAAQGEEKISIEDMKTMLPFIAGGSWISKICMDARPDGKIELTFSDPRVWAFAKSIRFSTVRELHAQVSEIHSKAGRISDNLREELAKMGKDEKPLVLK